MSRLSLLALIWSAAACTPVVLGSEGNLAFGFNTDDRLFPVDADTPMGQGLSADVMVYVSPDDRSPVDVSAASASPEGVVRVDEFTSNRIAVEAVGEGQGELAVTAGDVDDTFALEVREVAKLDLSYPGFLGAEHQPPVQVLEGGIASFTMRLEDSGGATLIGYGAVPLAIEPPAAASFVPGRGVGHARIAFTELGDVTVTGLEDEPLDLVVVPVSAVEDLELIGLLESNLEESLVFSVVATDASDVEVYGLEGVAEVVSDTPDACDVQLNAALGDTAYEVTAVADGECTVRAELGTHQVTRTFTVQTED